MPCVNLVLLNNINVVYMVPYLNTENKNNKIKNILQIIDFREVYRRHMYILI